MEAALSQLRVINQFRRLAKPAEKYTLPDILEHIGIRQEDFLHFGTIWRELGAAGIMIYEIFFSTYLVILPMVNQNFLAYKRNVFFVGRFLFWSILIG